MSRREVLTVGARSIVATTLAAGLASSLVSCARASATSIVLYTSADGEVADPILELFTRQTGISVAAVRDTEATKTTGLLRRILDERDSPRAQVFWSNEALAVARLNREGLLAPLPDGALVASLASRARVLVYDTRAIARGTTAPTGLSDLLLPAYKGRIGIAKPQFGTTRAHISAVRVALGTAGFSDWCKAMSAAGVRQYPGNSAVVRGIADGEISVGLTDTDDAWAGKRNGWPVEMAFPRDAAIVPTPIVIPNTVALIKNASDSRDALKLIDFLRGEEVERLMVESDLKHIPRLPGLVAKHPDRVPEGGAEPNWTALDSVSDEAVATWESLVG